MTVVLPIAYLGNIDYFAVWAQADEVLIEKFESYPKQTCRNRCSVYGANGPLDLTIPIIHGTDKLITSIAMDNSAPWRNRHWQALLSAYKSSPFFNFLEPELHSFYLSEGEGLFDELWVQTKTITKLMGLKQPVKFTDSYRTEYPDCLDLRDRFKPSKYSQLFPQGNYYQVFAEKHGYISNLSVLDLLCNEGRNALAYLKQVDLSRQ